MKKVKRFIIGATAGAVMFGSMALPAFANQAGAPAEQIGTGVAFYAQNSDPNLGQAVAQTGQNKTQDNEVLGFLHITPPGNTP